MHRLRRIDLKTTKTALREDFSGAFCSDPECLLLLLYLLYPLTPNMSPAAARLHKSNVGLL